MVRKIEPVCANCKHLRHNYKSMGMAIWAGDTREHKDGTITMTGKKHDVTEDVLFAATVWLTANKTQWCHEMESGTRLVLNVKIEKVEE